MKHKNHTANLLSFSIKKCYGQTASAEFNTKLFKWNQLIE